MILHLNLFGLLKQLNSNSYADVIRLLFLKYINCNISVKRLSKEQTLNHYQDEMDLIVFKVVGGKNPFIHSNRNNDIFAIYPHK